MLSQQFINILFAFSFIFLESILPKNPFLKKIMGKSMPLTDIGWKLLNKRWMFFFLGLAILNECVWRTQTEEFWVNFKVWGNATNNHYFYRFSDTINQQV